MGIYTILKSLLCNRAFIWDLVERELKGRYAGSMMGLFWTVLNPALTILVFVMIFSKIMAVRFGVMGETNTYIIFLCSGILPWNTFQETIHRSTNVFTDQSNLIKRVFFPKEILVAQIVVAATLNLVIGLGLFSLLLILLGHAPRICFLLLPPLILLQLLFTFGLSLIFSTLNVFFRDLSHLIGVVLHIWFWLTPIVYPSNVIPQRFLFLINLNPLTHLIGIYRDLLLHSNLPNMTQVLFLLLLSVITLIIGAKIHNHFKDQIPDEV